MMIGCCITWMLWKLGRIDGDPALRGTRIRATWEYVSSVEVGNRGWWVIHDLWMWRIVLHHRPTAT